MVCHKIARVYFDPNVILAHYSSIILKSDDDFDDGDDDVSDLEDVAPSPKCPRLARTTTCIRALHTVYQM